MGNMFDQKPGGGAVPRKVFLQFSLPCLILAFVFIPALRRNHPFDSFAKATVPSGMPESTRCSMARSAGERLLTSQPSPDALISILNFNNRTTSPHLVHPRRVKPRGDLPHPGSRKVFFVYIVPASMIAEDSVPTAKCRVEIERVILRYRFCAPLLSVDQREDYMDIILLVA